MLTGLCFALAGMLLNSLAGLWQSDATGRVTRQRSLLTEPRYLGGLVCDALGWLCAVVALRHLPVFAVHGVLGASIAVTAIAARVLYGSVLRRVDGLAIVGCLMGLVLVQFSAGEAQPSPASATAYVVLFAATGLLGVGTFLFWRGPRVWPLAAIGGLGLGGTSLAVRALRVDSGSASHLLGLLFQPAAYLMVLLWVIGMLAFTRALGLGSVAIVTAVMQVVEVIVPGLVGIALLGDTVRSGWQLPMATGLLVAAAGVVVLARSPARRVAEPVAVR
ncbi:MAG TPA: hypothetical protein VGH99_15705 [Pseudonocardia sp.]